MKKLALVLAMLLLFASACAEGFDFASMDDATLQAVFEGAQAELQRRNSKFLVDQDEWTIYLTGNYEEYGSDSYYAELETIVENHSDRNIDVTIESAAINGLDVYCSNIYETGAGESQQSTLDVCLSDANITSYDEIETIELVISINDAETFETIKLLDPITLTF